jgi:hypothetical protein
MEEVPIDMGLMGLRHYHVRVPACSGAQIELILERIELAPARKAVEDREHADPAAVLAAFFTSRRQQLADSVINTRPTPGGAHDCPDLTQTPQQLHAAAAVGGCSMGAPQPAEMVGRRVGRTQELAYLDAVEAAAQAILGSCMDGHEGRAAGKFARVALETVEVEGFRCFKDRIALNLAQAGVNVITGRNEADAGTLSDRVSNDNVLPQGGGCKCCLFLAVQRLLVLPTRLCAAVPYCFPVRV